MLSTCRPHAADTLVANMTHLRTQYYAALPLSLPPRRQWGEHFTNGVFTTKHLAKYRTCSADKADILQKDNLETTIVNPKDKSKKPPANCFDAVGMRAPPPPYSSDDTIYISG